MAKGEVKMHTETGEKKPEYELGLLKEMASFLGYGISAKNGILCTLAFICLFSITCDNVIIYM